jgi:hypothetical protein
MGDGVEEGTLGMALYWPRSEMSKKVHSSSGRATHCDPCRFP